jgi:iron complex outermembrane receptor protein
MATCAIAAGVLLVLALAPPVAAQPPDPDPPQPALPPGPPPVLRTGEVAITAAGSERPVLDVPGNVTVIDREAIERSGARDVPELLRREAGLFVTNDTGNPEGYRVEGRGFGNGGGNGSSLLVLLDGRRINEADSSFVDWSLVHLDRVERIEITRGPVSALYGDNAMAGVVRIVTRRGEGEPALRASGRAGSYHLRAGSLHAGGSAGPVAATLFVEGENLDGYRDRSAYEDVAVAGSLRVTPTDRASLELLAGGQDDDRERPGTLTREEIEQFGRDGADPGADLNRDRVHERWLQARGELVVSEGVVLALLPYYRRREDDARVVFPVSGGPDDLFALDQETASWGGSAQLELEREVEGHPSRTVAGLELLREDVDRWSSFDSASFGASTTTGRFHRTVWSFFAQEELALREDLLLSAGFRYDRADYDGRNRSESAFGPDLRELSQDPDKWSPRAALTWRARPDTSLYASYTRGFRFPNVDEAVGFTGALFDLGAQDSNAYELGAKHRGEALSANLALYWIDVSDEILFQHEIDAFGFPSPQNANVDRVRHRGAEAWASWRPRRWVELWASYTFEDAQIRRDRSSNLAALAGSQIPLVPRHRGTAGGILFLPFAVELGTNVNVVGDRVLVNDLQNEFADLDGYTTVDAHAAWRPRVGEHLELALLARVLNLFDHQYTEFAGEQTFTRGVIGINAAPDRHYEAGVTVTWRP